jgi:hypothetical protein
LAFVIVSTIASYFVAPGNTPIDRALPFVVVLMSICGFVANRWPQAMQVAVVLLFLPPAFLTDEHTRLLAYGVIVAGTFALCVAVAPGTVEAYAALTVVGVLLLRWIPFSEVIVWRELLVLLGALVVLVAYRQRTPMAIVAALAVALVTPIFPARAMVFPFVASVPFARIPLAIAFATAAYFTRYSIAVLCVVAAIALALPFLRRIHFAAYACAIALFAMWPWSGIVARAFPKFLMASPPPDTQQPVWVALERGQSVSIDAPPHKHATAITASGANAARFGKGILMGTVDIEGRTGDVLRREIRIGDIADFGFMRREHFFTSRNPPPLRPINDVIGYGQAAWLHTAGWMVIGSVDEIAAVHFFAARDLPPGTRLQIEAVDFE